MRLICLWCSVLVGLVRAQEEYYEPQTFRQIRQGSMFLPSETPWSSRERREDGIAEYGKGMFQPAGNDVVPQSTMTQAYRPIPAYEGYNKEQGAPRADWRLPYTMSKEQQAAILHHKQSLSSEGAFRFEYASDNGLAAGEKIEPDGSRIGAYQYKDPSGQLVKLKYRAGKEGFQILEGSHLPKSPEPVAPQGQGNYYQQAYEQQRSQYQLQQEYNQQKPGAIPPPQFQQGAEGNRGTGSQYYSPNFTPEGRDDGQYRDNYIEEQNRGPHSFGEGYAFAFQG